MVTANTSEQCFKIQTQMSCDNYKQFERKDGGDCSSKCSSSKREMTIGKNTDV